MSHITYQAHSSQHMFIKDWCHFVNLFIYLFNILHTEDMAKYLQDS